MRKLCVVSFETDVEIVSKLTAKLNVKLAVTDGQNLRDADTGTPLNRLDIGARCLGGVVVDHKNAEPLERFLSALAAVCALEPLSIITVTDPQASDAALEVAHFVNAGLNTIANRQANRIVDLSHALTSVRKLQDETLSSFRAIESFVWSNSLNTRTLSLSLAPSSNSSLQMEAGQFLVQRLPVSSVGLSDVEILCATTSQHETGTLTVILRTLEDDEEHARWIVDAPHLPEKSLRLSLPIALSSDSRTPVIELSLSGSMALSIERAMAHPDPRFQPQLNGESSDRVIAMRIWSSIPGSMATLPVNGTLPLAGVRKKVERRVIDGSMLSTAESLTPDGNGSMYSEGGAAIQVHPMPDGISAMCLRKSVPAETCQVSARIHTDSEDAQDVEYAIALLPSSEKIGPARLDQMIQNLCSEWVVLKPGARGEVHFFAKEPLQETYDLALLTRLSVRPGVNSYCWAKFDNIRLVTIRRETNE